MPKFDASSIGGDLDYDFDSLGQTNVKGTIPEPGRFQVKKFLKEVQNAFKELELVGKDAPEQASPDAIVSTMNAVDDEELFDKLTDRLTDCIAELCGNTYTVNEDGVKQWNTDGSPTRNQIAALKYRHFMVFFAYIMQNLMSPELSRPGTNNSRVKLTSV